jgi:hypothetical protein
MQPEADVILTVYSVGLSDLKIGFITELELRPAGGFQLYVYPLPKFLAFNCNDVLDAVLTVG